jgi:hypothetical protein
LQCRNKRDREEFAEQLFGKIVEALDRHFSTPAPDGPPAVPVSKPKSRGLRKTVHDVPAPLSARLELSALTAVTDAELERINRDRRVLQLIEGQDREFYYEPAEGAESTAERRAGEPTVPGERYEALSFLETWTREQDAPPYFALLGETGMGKTTTCYLAHTLPEGTNVDAAWATICAVHNLRDMAERPYTLSLIASEFQRIEEWKQQGHRVTGATLYDHMVQSWLERDAGKHQLSPAHKRLLMEHCAAALWKAGQRAWTLVELEQWLVDFFTARPALRAHYTEQQVRQFKTDLRTATFLVHDRKAGSFRFAHTSLQEFFLAGYLHRALLEKRPDDWDMAGRAWRRSISSASYWRATETRRLSRRSARFAAPTGRARANSPSPTCCTRSPRVIRRRRRPASGSRVRTCAAGGSRGGRTDRRLTSPAPASAVRD